MLSIIGTHALCLNWPEHDREDSKVRIKPYTVFVTILEFSLFVGPDSGCISVVHPWQ